jgi:hypothetical protein
MLSSFFKASIIFDAQTNMGGLNLRSLSAFETTVTDEIAMAPAAKMGLSRMPKNGKRTPAATGMRIVL